jgi:hypothetical protein
MSKVSHLFLQFAAAACLTVLCLGLIVGSPAVHAKAIAANCTACTYSCADGEKDKSCSNPGDSGCTCTCQPIASNDPTGASGCKVPPAT